MSNMVTATYSGESAKQVFDPNNNSYPKPYIIADDKDFSIALFP